MDVPDLDAVMAAMKTDAAADAMAYDSVLPETVVILVGVTRTVSARTRCHPSCGYRLRQDAVRKFDETR